MRFVCCEDRKEVESVEIGGYSLGHYTNYGEPNELDLEGINFTFSTDDDGEIILTDADGAESYLSKFGNWEEVIVDAAKSMVSPTSVDCPDCGGPTWILEDDEPLPE